MGGCVTNRVIMCKKWDTIKASFEPKRFKMGKEKAEFSAIYHWEIA